MCPAEALNLVLTAGSIALVGALLVGALAFLAIASRPLRVAAEGPLGRFADRHLRIRHGIAPDAPRWACRSCHSVNEATAVTCYSCGASAVDTAQPIPPAADETWRPPPTPNRFDPARYRGPGAPDPAERETATGGPEAGAAEPLERAVAAQRPVREGTAAGEPLEPGAPFDAP
jgi:hypothetical protein